MAKRTDRFIWQPGNITIEEVKLPDKLKKLVKDAPKGDKARAKWLAKKVTDGEITAKEAAQIIESGALA